MNSSLLGNCKLISVSNFKDDRGTLSVLSDHIPTGFLIRRVYSVSDTRQGSSRGGHSHKVTRQIIFVLSGQLRVTLNDGRSSQKLVLAPSETGLLLEPLVWSTLDPMEDNTTYVVLCDLEYSEAEYIRDWKTYLELIGEHQ